MIAGLKPYPVMKDSGVEQLGKVPEHWNVRELGRIGAFFKGNGGTKEDEVADGVPCVRYGDLYTRHCYYIEQAKSCVSEARAAAYTPIRFGDVLFAGSGETIEEIGKSAVNLLDEPACCGGDVIIFRPSIDLEPRFVGLATDCPQAAYQKSCMGRGITVMHIYGSELKYLSIALPPAAEQAAIVRYLDHVDRRVRRLVRAKRKLITLLTEQKQAIIHRAVSRGLDLDVPLKESGVEWLGEVPAHWEILKLSQCGTVTGGMTPSMEVRRFWNGGIPWVTPKDMKSSAISDSSVRVTAAALDETSLRLIAAGSVLFVVRGMILARKVPVAWTTNAVTINQDMKAILPGAGLDARFLAMLLDSMQDALFPLIDEAGHGTKRLPTERWKNLALGVPPLPEQVAIVNRLSRTAVEIDTAISAALRTINLLTEYRTRLTADVVTGKLDVREAAATLPEIDPLAADDEPDTLDAGSETDLDELDEIPEEAEV